MIHCSCLQMNHRWIGHHFYKMYNAPDCSQFSSGSHLIYYLLLSYSWSGCLARPAGREHISLYWQVMSSGWPCCLVSGLRCPLRPRWRWRSCEVGTSLRLPPSPLQRQHPFPSPDPTLYLFPIHPVPRPIPPCTSFLTTS